MRNNIVFFGAAFLLTACLGGSGGGNTDGNSATVATIVDDYNDAAVKVAEAECACFEAELGFENRQDCVDGRAPTRVLTSCQEQAASCDANGFRSLIACEESALDEYRACISSCSGEDAPGSPDIGDSDAGASGGTSLLESCEQERQGAMSRCQEDASSTLQEDFAACAAGEQPGCVSNANTGSDAGPEDGGSDAESNRDADASGVDGDSGPAEEDAESDSEDGGPDAGDDEPDAVDGGEPDAQDGEPDAQDTGAEVDFEKVIDDRNTAAINRAEIRCDCYWEDLGYTSKTNCVDSTFTLELAGCVEQAIPCDEAGILEHLECETKALADDATCLNSCPQGTARDDCEAAHLTAHDHCASLYPEDFEDAINECWSGTTPTCGN